MNKIIKVTFLAVFIIGCTTIPTTAIYRETEGQISPTIHVLPITDDTADGRIDDISLVVLKNDLIKKLNASGKFLAVYEMLPASNQENITRVKCKVTQFDTSSRRMVMVTELLQDNSDRPFFRFVSHTLLASVVWPFDYAAVMKRAGKAVVKDVSETIVHLMKSE